MPNYQFLIAEGSPSSSRKTAIAEAITVAHNTTTGAPGGYVYVSFVEIPATSLFVSGVQSPVGRLTGLIRRGRTDDLKKRLMLALAEAWSRAGEEPSDKLAIFVHEIPGFQAMEDGVLLPEAWEDADAILA